MSAFTPWRWLPSGALVEDIGKRRAVLVGRELMECGEDGRLKPLDLKGPRAKLIEAAPELLAALCRLVDNCHSDKATLDQARAAIAATATAP